MRRPAAALLTLLLLGAAGAEADNWPGPRVFTEFSESYGLQHEITLTNPVLPVSALVADDGHVITFDNWHNLGFGKVAAIYAPTGRLVRSWELTDLYDTGKVESIFVEPREQKSVYVAEALGGSFVFTLATGHVAYTGGARKECTPPRR